MPFPSRAHKMRAQPKAFKNPASPIEPTCYHNVHQDPCFKMCKSRFTWFWDSFSTHSRDSCSTNSSTRSAPSSYLHLLRSTWHLLHQKYQNISPTKILKMPATPEANKTLDSPIHQKSPLSARCPPPWKTHALPSVQRCLLYLESPNFSIS